jgi:hypothetical protein
MMLIAYVGTSAQAASGASNLIYIRQKQEDGFQLVSLSSSGQQVFQVLRDNCAMLSPNMTYLALSHPESKTIEVYQLSDGEIISNIPLETTQSGCDFSWQNETVLNLLDASINVLDGRIHSIAEQTPSTRPQVTVPDLLADDFRLMSPDNSLIVYNRCEGGEFTSNRFTSDRECTSEEEVVIYDLRRRQVVQALQDTQQGRFVLDEYEHLAFSFIGISWSPSGRYLAYRTGSATQGIPPLRIYDTYANRYIDLELPPSWDIDWFKGFVWTRNEQSLAFWVRNNEVQGERLAIADVETGQVTFSAMQYQLAQANWERGLGNTVVFVDSDHNLVEYDLDTGNTTVLDTDVSDILSR